MRESFLPIEFNSLSGKVNYVVQVGRNEWSSSCPKCGGVPHQDGSPPDRFRMWTNANGKNKVMGWCRHCGYVWFPDRPDAKVDPQEFEQWRREQIQREERKRQEAEQALRLLRSEKIWERYHANMGQALCASTLTEWGIPEEHANAWKLGFIPDFVVHSKGDEYHSPAITIPIWQPDWEIKNVKVRVLNPRTSADRYRKIYKTGQDGAFWTNPSLKTDTCLIVEGEKKAMVAYRQVPEDLQVVGLPTKTPSPELLATFAKFKKIYLCLDPDAEEDAVKVSRELGKFRTYVVTLAGKVDDMINHNELNLMDALTYSRRIL